MQRFYLKTLEKITAFTWKHVTVCLSENNEWRIIENKNPDSYVNISDP